MKRREPLSTVFGRRLRTLRQARGMTQEQVAQAVGIGPKHLGEIERGHATPSFDVIEGLAGVLNVDYAALFLPTTSPVADAAEEVERLAGRADRLEPLAVRAFLDDLMHALRKLDKRRGR